MKSNMIYSDAILGIRRNYRDLFWQDVRADFCMVLGYTDVGRQVEYIQEQTDKTFKIEMNRASVNYRPWLAEISKLKNVIGLSLVKAPNLKIDDIAILQNIRQLFSMNFFPELDLSAFPLIERLAAHSDCEYSGFEYCPNLVQMTWYFPVNKKYDFSRWYCCENLERLQIFHGRVESLGHFAVFENLRMLEVSPATRLTDLSEISSLKKLEALVLSKAVKVLSWEPLLEVSQTLNIYLEESKIVDFPQYNPINFPNLKFDLHKTKIIHT